MINDLFKMAGDLGILLKFFTNEKRTVRKLPTGLSKKEKEYKSERKKKNQLAKSSKRRNRK